MISTLREATRIALAPGDTMFAEDSTKALGSPPNDVTGPDTNRLARQTLAVRPDTRTFMADDIKRASQ